MEILDFHTHAPAPGALLSLDIAEIPTVTVAAFCESGDSVSCAPLSLGLHPWSTARPDTAELMQKLEALARSPQVLAIGEAGLDTLRGAPMDIQEELFRRHIRLSEQLAKPLIIHLVKALDPLLRIRREERPRQPWVFHGFRANPSVALQLLRLENRAATQSNTPRSAAPIYFSLGPKFNPATAKAIPPDRLLIETDDSGVPVSEVLGRLADTLGLPAPLLAARIAANSVRLLGTDAKENGHTL